MNDSEKRKTKFYSFYINNHTRNKPFTYLKNNYISTTKYNIITFLPKSLLLQFTRLPNVYFLIIAILQSIPAISPLTSVTAILPLAFVLVVSMLRELVEDIARYQYDKLNNNRKVIIFKDNQFIEEISENIEVGDIILVDENEEFPCDLILLDSSNPDGICYIETGSLDGEKNLKNKISNIDLKGIFYHKGVLTQNFLNIVGKTECDMPNPELYKFDGKMSLIWNNSNNDDIEQLNYVLTAGQLLLKGALLRQTKQIAGIVVYTGSNNKILLNSKNPKMKLRKIKELKPDIVVITGDMGDGSLTVKSNWLSPFDTLSIPILYITGNHEQMNGKELMIAEVNETSIKYIGNDIYDFDNLIFVGVDYEYNLKKRLNEITPHNEDKLNILLCHVPQLKPKDLKDYDIFLFLAGHTHGGQIFPFHPFVILANACFNGLYEKCLDDMLMCHEELCLLNLIDEEPYCQFEEVYPYNEGLNGDIN